MVAGGLALMWTGFVPSAAWAQDGHAGHDHADHSENDHAEHAVHAPAEEGHRDDRTDHTEHEHETHVERDDSEAHVGHDHGDEGDDHAVETDAHAGHDHGEHAEEGLRLTTEQRRRFGVVVRPATGGSLRNEIRLPGEIVFNEDHVVHIVPRVAGIARDVVKSVGDRVKAGDLLAVIESRELADARSEYLAAKARHALAEKSFSREKRLREKEISSEQDYLEAEQVLAKARIDLRSADQKLHALGLQEDAVEALDTGQDDAITRYEIRAPIGGVVTEKHIALGESLSADADIFTLVDTHSVWVDLTVYTRNLGAVRVGQEVVLRVDHNGAQTHGEIAMVTPFVEETTRSATARVILDNRDGRWVPGTFVTGFTSVSEDDLPVVVPLNAVQNIDGRDVVFVEHEGGFEIAPVTTGRTGRDHMEVVTGLDPGTPYVAEGAFQLKATAVTSSLGSHAGHGH